MGRQQSQSAQSITIFRAVRSGVSSVSMARFLYLGQTFNADSPTSIITHVNADSASGIGKFIDQRLLDVKLDPVSLQRQIFAVVYGFSDPTDRPFDPVSSADDGAAREYCHDPAEFGNELNLPL